VSRTAILTLIALTALALAGCFVPEPAPTRPALSDLSVVTAIKDGYTAVEQHWTIPWHTRTVIGLNTTSPNRDVLRAWRGDFCGVPFPSPLGPPLIYTPMYPVFDQPTRAAMRKSYKQAGYTHWPISVAGGYAVNGKDVYPRFDYSQKPEAFRVFVDELWNDSLIPVVFLMDDKGPHTAGYLKHFIDVNADLIRAASIGWELNHWMTDEEATQAATDLRGLLWANTLLYLHMTPERAALCHTDSCESSWWRSMRGVLTGILYQHGPDASIASFQDRLSDFTTRLIDGKNGWPTGFDVVAFEYAAYRKFRGTPAQYGIDRGNAAMQVKGVIGYGDGGSGR
jgi:hypothetical protein